MKKLSIFYFILILGLAMFITSCSDDFASVNQLQENDEVLETRGKKIDKSFTGEYQTDPKVIGFTLEGFPIIEITSEGIATHVGKSTWYGLHISKFSGDMEGIEFILTAVNGDRFWGTYDGFAINENPPFGPVSFSGHLYVDDGDGRFTGAKGTIHYYGEASVEGGGFLIFDEGTLTY